MTKEDCLDILRNCIASEENIEQDLDKLIHFFGVIKICQLCNYYNYDCSVSLLIKLITDNFDIDTSNIEITKDFKIRIICPIKNIEFFKFVARFNTYND